MTESVWDYPRPPRVEPTRRRIQIVHRDTLVVDTVAALRVLETSHPPVYYLPPSDVHAQLLPSAARPSYCEFKGTARYWDLVLDAVTVPAVAWSYDHPSPGYESLAGRVAFYPGRVDECTVDGERVVAQAGDFYGGWITADVTGPFKGAPGTRGW